MGWAARRLLGHLAWEFSGGAYSLWAFDQGEALTSDSNCHRGGLVGLSLGRRVIKPELWQQMARMSTFLWPHGSSHARFRSWHFINIPTLAGSRQRECPRESYAANRDGIGARLAGSPRVSAHARRLLPGSWDRPSPMSLLPAQMPLSPGTP